MIKYVIISSLMFVVVLVTISLSLNTHLDYNPIKWLPVFHTKAYSMME